MSDIRSDLGDVLKQVGGAWGWLLAFGVIGILAGLSVLFFTGDALLVIAIAFGVWLVFSGMFRFAAAFAVPDESGWLRALYALLALFSVVAGAYLLGHPVLSLVLLTFLVGVFWIFHGIVEMFIGIEAKGVPGRGWTIFSGILGIFVGSMVIAVPGISIVALTYVLGFWLIGYGVVLCVSAVQVRSSVHAAKQVLAPRHV